MPHFRAGDILGQDALAREAREPPASSNVFNRSQRYSPMILAHAKRAPPGTEWSMVKTGGGEDLPSFAIERDPLRMQSLICPREPIARGCDGSSNVLGRRERA
jgi:hypothetical protein